MLGTSQLGRMSLGSELASSGARLGLSLNGKFLPSSSGPRSSSTRAPPPGRMLSLAIDLDPRHAPLARAPPLVQPQDPKARRRSMDRDTPPAPPSRPSDAPLPPCITALLDPACDPALPPPGSLALTPAHNRELDKLVAQLGRGRATWRRALALLDWLRAGGHAPDDRLCTTLIRVAAQHGEAGEALAIYDWMRRPRREGGAGLAATVYTYTAAARAALAGGMLHRALAVWDDAAADPGCAPDCRLATTLIEVCARTGDADRALGVYARMLAAPRGSRLEPSVHAFTATMRAVAEGGRAGEALAIWADMQRLGCKPTGHAYAAVISACAAGGEWERAVGLFDEMLAARIRPDVVSCTALVAALGAAGQPRRAEGVVRWMARAEVRPNVRTYTALLAAHAGVGDWDRALGLLRELRAGRHGPGLEPNAYTYSALLKAAGEQGEVGLAETLFEGLELEARLDAAKQAALGALRPDEGTWDEGLEGEGLFEALETAAAMGAAPTAKASAVIAGPLESASAWRSPGVHDALTVPESSSSDPDLDASHAAALAVAAVAVARPAASPTACADPQLERLLCTQLGPALGGVDGAASSTPRSGPRGPGAGAEEASARGARGAGDHAVPTTANCKPLLAVSGVPISSSPFPSAATPSDGPQPSLRLAAAAAAAWGVASLDARGAAWGAGDDYGSIADGGTPALAGTAAASGGRDVPSAPHGSPASVLPASPPPSGWSGGGAEADRAPRSAPPAVNHVVCGAMMSVYERAGRAGEAVGMLRRARALGVRPNTVMLNTALSALGKAGRVDEARALFARIPDPDAASYETLVAALGARGLAAEAEATVAAMRAAGHAPRHYAYCGLVAAHGVAGDWRAALAVRRRMAQEGLQPNVHVYNALLGVCNQAGQWDASLALVREMRGADIQGNLTTAQLLEATGRGGAGSVDRQAALAAALSATVGAAGVALMQTGFI
ncbi:MCA1 [Auxenochlorella protothecoides x Auxenochlorella symbiontica]